MDYLTELGYDLNGLVPGSFDPSEDYAAMAAATKAPGAAEVEMVSLNLGKQMYVNGKYRGGNVFVSAATSHEMVHYAQYMSPDGSCYLESAYNIDHLLNNHEMHIAAFWDFEGPAYNAELASVRQTGLAPAYVRNAMGILDSYGLQGSVPFMYPWTQPRPRSFPLFQLLY